MADAMKNKMALKAQIDVISKEIKDKANAGFYDDMSLFFEDIEILKKAQKTTDESQRQELFSQLSFLKDKDCNHQSLKTEVVPEELTNAKTLRNNAKDSGEMVDALAEDKSFDDSHSGDREVTKGLALSGNEAIDRKEGNEAVVAYSTTTAAAVIAKASEALSIGVEAKQASEAITVVIKEVAALGKEENSDINEEMVETIADSIATEADEMADKAKVEELSKALEDQRLRQEKEMREMREEMQRFMSNVKAMTTTVNSLAKETEPQIVRNNSEEVVDTIANSRAKQTDKRLAQESEQQKNNSYITEEVITTTVDKLTHESDNNDGKAIEENTATTHVKTTQDSAESTDLTEILESVDSRDMSGIQESAKTTTMSETIESDTMFLDALAKYCLTDMITDMRSYKTYNSVNTGSSLKTFKRLRGQLNKPQLKAEELKDRQIDKHKNYVNEMPTKSQVFDRGKHQSHRISSAGFQVELKTPRNGKATEAPHNSSTTRMVDPNAYGCN